MKETEWEIRPPKPQPPPPLAIRTVNYGAHGTVAHNGTVCLWDIDSDGNLVRGVNIHWLIASLQSILVLATEHFGENWGK